MILKPAAKAATRPGAAPRLSSRGWLVVLVIAAGYLIWLDFLRAGHIKYVSGVGENPPGAAAGAPAPTPSSWQPRLVVPDHNNPSYEWLDQTRQMFARHEWRVRHVDYENAPFGRDVYAASPYRWWLGLIAWVDHAFSGRSSGASLERAAVVADPLLHLMLLVGVVLFAWRQLGTFAAAMLGFGLTALFPLAAEYLAGMPDDRGLARALAIWSLLLLIAGTRAAQTPVATAEARVRRWFLAAGIVGGLGLWVSVSSEAPFLLGTVLGGMIAAWTMRTRAGDKTDAGPMPLPWRLWAFGGAVTTLAASLIEYFPSYLGNWQLRTIHPLYGAAWLGGGEVLARLTAWIQGPKQKFGVRDALAGLLALAALAAVPAAMRLTHNLAFLEANLSDLRLARLPDGPAAANFAKWIFRDGVTSVAWATLLPALLAGPAFWLLLRREGSASDRGAIALTLGPVFVALGFAYFQLSWWSGVDAALIGVIAAGAAAVAQGTSAGVMRWIWSGLAALVLLPGAVQYFPRTEKGDRNALTEQEVYGLLERDFARWLSGHAGPGGAVVLAPHNQTFTLHYYGGLRGLATLGWENLDGLEAAMRIASASTPEEAKELIDRRGVGFIVIPSWDSYLNVYARMGMGKLEGTFLNRLLFWRLPPWLRPVPYQIPTIAGFEGQTVTVLEVVEDQDDAAGLSRLAEYFVEMGQLDLAGNSALSLRRYPADLGALVARAQVAFARDDTADFGRILDQVRTRLSGGADRSMQWDRRVSLAIALARGKRAEQAREQLQRCLADVDEAKLRSLSPGALYRLQVLEKAFGLEIADLHLRQMARDLLPDDFRARLKP